ncbi:MAG TPA: hypothetical protein VHF22_12950, partial [Planctomycetota bacterium]|nr:hypothetical protein [Planctomycetota bacterium]
MAERKQARGGGKPRGARAPERPGRKRTEDEADDEGAIERGGEVSGERDGRSAEPGGGERAPARLPRL